MVEIFLHLMSGSMLMLKTPHMYYVESESPAEGSSYLGELQSYDK